MPEGSLVRFRIGMLAGKMARITRTDTSLSGRIMYHAKLEGGPGLLEELAEFWDQEWHVWPEEIDKVSLLDELAAIE